MKTKFLPICMLVLLITFTQAFAQRPSFNTATDILIAQFDSKPDPDDIHAQAALGCMLAHPDLAGVNYYAVAGAVGTQNGQFIDSDALFDMAFGSNNWTDADANWSASVTNIKNKVIPILQNGGKVWVQEAGQSNITADWIAQVLQTVAAATVKNNVVVVQHSEWNEDNTATSDLSYVQDKAWYFAIDNGNAADGAAWGDRGPWGTPQYTSQNNTWIAQAKSSVNPKANQLWTEADNVIDTLWPNGFPHDWSAIHFDGVDYSDCVENWWIFEIGTDANNVAKFWSRYVTNTPSGSNNVTGVNITPTTLSINVGQTASLTASVLPSNATNKSVSWSSNNLAVATVNTNGVVAAVAAGSATITATTIDGGFKATSVVTVSTSGTSQTVTLLPIHDAYTQNGTNQNNTLVRVENSGRVRIGYLQYDMSGINGTISSAQLKMTCNSDAGNAALAISAALGSNSNWTEGNVSSANAPSSSGTLGTKQGPFNQGTTYTWNLNTSLLSGSGNVSLILTASGSTDDVAFASKENSATEPQLVITYNSTSTSKTLEKQSGTSELVSALKVYPNPISGNSFVVDLRGYESDVQISIFDVHGRLLYENKVSPQELKLKSDIFRAAGIYMLNVRSFSSGEAKTLLIAVQ